MPVQYSDRIIEEAEWFYRLLLIHGAHQHSAVKFRHALQAGSPVLNTHARTAWDNAFSRPADAQELPAEDRRRAAEFLAELDELRQSRGGRRPGAGRPALPPDQRRQRYDITLRPETIARLEERAGGKRIQASRLAARIIEEAVDGPDEEGE